MPGRTVVIFAPTTESSDLQVEVGEPTWIPALVAVPADGDGLVVDTVTYDVTIDGAPAAPGLYTPTPEGLLSAS